MTITTSPAPLPADALDRALATLEWTVHSSAREHLPAGTPIHRAHAASGFVYVSSGRARIDSLGSQRMDIAAGDLVFFPRAHTTVLVALDDAEILDVAFSPAPQRQAVADTMPEWLYVRDFAEQERTMVALVNGLGTAKAGEARRPGDAVICSRIATTIVSAALRSWSEAGCAPKRWLNRVGDPHITAVLDAIHAEPGRAWTLADLARGAAMSRTAFAERFRLAVGQTPRAYLTSVRMETAKGLIRGSDIGLTELASTLGYSSEDGFARAFRRHTGSTPSRWRAEAALSR